MVRCGGMVVCCGVLLLWWCGVVVVLWCDVVLWCVVVVGPEWFH